MKAVLFRERQKNYLYIPSSLTALNECIVNHSFMKNICKIIIKDENGKVAILFTTETLLQILNVSQTIYADGTFSVSSIQICYIRFNFMNYTNLHTNILFILIIAYM